jgi:LysR family transcriptional regulator for bpeEF and oprC
MHATIHAMNVFVRAVETNSFVGAARALLIDPAAVSRTIKSLEAHLGVLLFARSTRTLKLTGEGTRFYRDCIEILRKVEEATERFRADRQMPHGELKVGMPPGLTRRLLLRAIPPFKQQYPKIKLILLSVDEMAGIGDKGVDVLLRVRSLRQHGGLHHEPQGLVVRKLAQTRRIACASPEYLKRAGLPREPDDLAHHACVALLTQEHDVHDEWQFANAKARRTIKVTPSLLVQGTDALREAALAGCGIIQPLIWHVEDELRSRALVPVLADWKCLGGERPMVAIYRKTQPMRLQVSLFIKHLVESFKKYNRRSERGLF